MAEDVPGTESLAEVFGDIARQLESQDSLQDTWQQIVEIAVETIPGAEHAAVSIVHASGTIRTDAATDDVGRAVDAIQYETQQGPCLSAIRDNPDFITPDLAGETRWPEFSRRAAEETGVRSMISMRLFLEEDVLGALNIYAKEVDVFDDVGLAIGRTLAAHAAVAAAAAKQDEKVDQLETALDSNRRISMAVGLLMAASNIDEDHAFDVLRTASQRLGLPIAKVAERVLASHADHTPG